MFNYSFEKLKHNLKHFVTRPAWPGIRKKERPSSVMFSDYFSLLSVLPTFDIDIKTLETAYFREQRANHPDRFIGKPEDEKLKAAQRSADINQAYEALKDPLKRAQYLLLLQGIFVGTDKDSIKPSQELLMEVMEYREQLDNSRSPAESFAIADKLKEEKERTIRMISVAYDSGQWDKMAHLTLKLGYLQKTLDDSKLQKARI